MSAFTTNVFKIQRPSKACVTFLHSNPTDGDELSALHVAHPAKKKLICTVYWPGGSAVVCTNTQHPVVGLSPEITGSFANSDIKVVYLVKGLQVGTGGSPSVWLPKNAQEHAATLKRLEDCPLSMMGYSLSLASLGEEVRHQFQPLFVSAFGTVEHPFVAVRNPGLDEAILVAYAGVGAQWFLLLVFVFHLTATLFVLVFFPCPAHNQQLCWAIVGGRRKRQRNTQKVVDCCHRTAARDLPS